MYAIDFQFKDKAVPRWGHTWLDNHAAPIIRI